MTLSGATTPGQSGPGNNVTKGVLCIPQSSSINGVLPSDCLEPYQEYSLRKFYPFAEIRSGYFAAPVTEPFLNEVK